MKQITIEFIARSKCRENSTHTFVKNILFINILYFHFIINIIFDNQFFFLIPMLYKFEQTD